MKKLTSLEIRDSFLSFFKNKDHMEIPDASIIPKNDPTLLFINSGMAPIKNYFTGVEKPPYPRLCDVQPCIRTIDIDSIGDKHHLTSFQMLGSWSINNYFKEKAIRLAFEFLTQGLEIPQEKLYVTVFAGDENLGVPCDDEAYGYWQKVGMPESHIVKCGIEDNFWGPTAETGPCGPCTEIFFDTGVGQEYVPGGEFDTKQRYIEIWNAGVFMQFNKNADGSFSKLSFTSVDTGAGLERLAMVLNGCKSVYETDLLEPIKKAIEHQLGEAVKSVSEREILIMTDHLRTTALILSEKVAPSNEGRGYIPRKLIRRCMMIIEKHKVKDFDFMPIIEFITENYKNIFSKFESDKSYILEKFSKEYGQFKKVLINGLEKLEDLKLKSGKISAVDAFELVTTYGLPIDIIEVFALENSMELDKLGFEKKLEEHKSKSKGKSESGFAGDSGKIEEMLKDTEPTEFLGYEFSTCDSKIVKTIENEAEISNTKSSDKKEFVLVLDKTVFYAQSGGQCADTGIIKNKNFTAKVTDVKKSKNGVIMHFCEIVSGELAVGDVVNCEIDFERRQKISNNHTAVHLLQSALQEVYGKNVHQAGSDVEPERLRFDFNYEGTITEDEICKIESIVNSNIRKNIERNVEIQNVADAIKSGAMALFESKYGEKVRVVSYGDVSKELCGGTHTERTGNIGTFIILSSEGIGKGIKRITAITGDCALKYIQNKISDINKIAKFLKVKPENAFEKLKKDLESASAHKKEVLKSISVNDIKPLNATSDLPCGYIEIPEGGKKTASEISKLADKSGTALFGIIGTDKKQMVIAVADALVEKVFANDILKKIMLETECKGGGSKKMASCALNIKTEDILKILSKIL